MVVCCRAAKLLALCRVTRVGKPRLTIGALVSITNDFYLFFFPLALAPMYSMEGVPTFVVMRDVRLWHLPSFPPFQPKGLFDRVLALQDYMGSCSREGTRWTLS